MPTKTRRPRKLELKQKDLQKNAIALFKSMERSEEARTAFIDDPAGQIARRVTKQKLPPQQASEANRMLFAILSNDAMVKWLQAYRPPTGRWDKKTFSLDFVRQIQKLNDPQINAGVLGNAALGVGIPGLGDVAYQCVVNETPNKYDCACTPVAKDHLPASGGVDPENLRVLTEHLIQQAKSLAAQGRITDLARPIS